MFVIRFGFGNKASASENGQAHSNNLPAVVCLTIFVGFFVKLALKVLNGGMKIGYIYRTMSKI